jgi:spermidine synthase
MSVQKQHLPQSALVWLLVCFTCSGMSALIYEVAWVRCLELVFGATTFAVATVLAAFMGGLAFGSYFMGRFSSRWAKYHPLKVYGLIELGIGLIALVIPLVFASLAPVYQALWKQFHASFALLSTARFLLCVLVLLVPTSLMGATLPVMSSFVNRDPKNGKNHIGLLYTFNTAGAVLGCVVAGFLLFPAVGLQKTQLAAVILSTTAALGAWMLSRRQPQDAAEPPTALSDPANTTPDALPRQEMLLLVTLYAVSGFAAMAYEVAWSRTLVLVLGSSTYAYTIMLATFLSGLALGAWLAARFLVRAAPPLLMAGLCQVFVALTTFLGLFLVEELPFLYLAIHEKFQPGLWGMMGLLFFLSAGLMILPTLGLGAMFPVTIQGLNPQGATTARVVGWAYSLNTLGAIAGSVIAGFWLMPRVGTKGTLLIGTALSALMGLLGVWAVKTGPLSRLRAVVALLLALFCGNLYLSYSPWDPGIMTCGIFRYVKHYYGMSRQAFFDKIRQSRGQVLSFQEGLSCTVTITRTISGLSLFVNGKPDASTPLDFSPPWYIRKPLPLADLPTQTLLGEIPLLLAPQRNDVMVIGLGSGVTVGSVLRHPVKTVECVELEDAVVQGSQYFNHFSGNPLTDPRTHLVVNDARNHLLLTDRHYDVIISEPSNPWIPGAANLFTRDFFELARTRLRPDGLFCQWVQLYELHETDFQTILRSFMRVFPHLHVFRTGPDAIIVGSLNPLPILPETLKSRCTPAVTADLARINISSLEDFLAHYWVGGEELVRKVGTGFINTDDNMFIEFKAPLRVLLRTDAAADFDRFSLAALFEQHSSALIAQYPKSGETPDSQAAFWARMAEAALKQERPVEATLYARHSLSLQRNPAGARFLAEALQRSGKSDLAQTAWQSGVKEFPTAPEFLTGLVRIQAQEKRWTEARQTARDILITQPTNSDALYALANAAVNLEDWETATQALSVTGRFAPGKFPDLTFLLGSLQWQQGRYPEAIKALSETLNDDLWNFPARERLADALNHLGRREEALNQWQRLGQLRSSQAQVRLQESRRAQAKNLPDVRNSKLEEALRLDPWNDDINLELAQLRCHQHRFTEAAQTLEKYLTNDADRPWAVGLLGQVYGLVGRTNEARIFVNRFHSLTGKPWQEMEFR